MMTERQRSTMERLAEGQTVEVWWEAGGTRWRFRVNGSAEGITPEFDEAERPHHRTVLSLVTRGWARERTYGRARTKVRHRLGYPRSITTYQITKLGRQALVLERQGRAA